ncbi:MAG: hypothetical protein KGJ86_02680 [Chloroflexota bacterium]|nr:hypothetical protein [Chloroflexota bacterium]
MKPLLLAAVLVVLAGCSRGGPVDPAVLQPPSSAPAAAHRPDHVTLPADDAAHDDLTEWWYYTGHLKAANGATYGFELVTFQGNRADTAPAYAAHFAVTDNARQTFRFAERSVVGAQPRPQSGFRFQLNDWLMEGVGGQDHLAAQMDGYAVDLRLRSSKPAVLHDGKGLISFGPAGDSYYYSRTRLTTTGTIVDHGRRLAVTGMSWMDHQWGNFISAGGGWDWFSMQLDDDTELMLFLLRDRAGNPAGSYGTLVGPAGRARTLLPSEYAVRATGSWTSRQTGVTYPSGWRVQAADAELTLTPTVKGQELRTVASTGVNYWEGDVAMVGSKGGEPIEGLGYVELVGYRG